MILYLNLLVLILLQSTSSRPQTTPARGCLTCKTKPTKAQPSVESNSTVLAAGESCGVYTLSCANGLRCAPLEGELRPLRALLEGRGVCSNGSSISPTEKIQTVDPATTEDPNEAPCRKLLTTLIQGLNAHLFNAQHDIYMPNCDKRGFFRKKQCWSSRGKQRGRCWCVNKSGIPLTPPKNKSQLSC